MFFFPRFKSFVSRFKCKLRLFSVWLQVVVVDNKGLCVLPLLMEGFAKKHSPVLSQDVVELLKVK